MKTKILLPCILLTALLINACVSEFNAVLPSEDNELLIVDGSILEDTVVHFYLSKSFSLNDQTIPPDSWDVNATIVITGSDGWMSDPAVYLGKGEYELTIGHLNDNVSYGIEIMYDGEVYRSTPAKPLLSSEIDSVSWIQPVEGEDVIFRVSTHDVEDQKYYYMWNYVEDWEITAHYYTTVFFDTTTVGYYTIYPPPYYYCWKNNRKNKILIGSTESLVENRIINKELYREHPSTGRFTVLYSVLLSQRTISKSAYEYYLNKQTLNEGMGGLFTPQPSELGGNIICISNPSKKAIGYVEASKKTSQKRIFVDRSEILGRSSYDRCESLSSDSVRTFINNAEITISDFYMMGYRPLGSFSEDISWTEWRCTDCVMSGGTKKKPDFWPNNHE